MSAHFDSVARTIDVPAGFGNDFDDPIAAAPRAVWVAGPTGVSKIDVATGKVHPRLSLTGVADLVPYGGSAWALLAHGSLVRLDTSGDFVGETISLSSTATTTAAAAGLGSLWVVAAPTTGPGPEFAKVGGGAALYRIDPANGEVTAKVKLDGAPTAVAVGHDAIWVADSERREVLRVDPRGNRVSARIPLGARPTSIAVDDNSVWVAVT